MAINAVTPYLTLGGKAEDAIELYKQALGAELKAFSRFGDVDKSCPEALKNRVMHAELKVGSARVMLSDGSPESRPSPGGTVNVALAFDDPAHARSSFEALSSGGTVVQPLMDAPWGSLFGALRDRYGVDWMFDSKK